LAVQTFDLISLPYPSRFGLWNAARALSPYMLITNRMLLVQFQQFGRIKNLLMEPTDFELGQATPFFKRLADRGSQPPQSEVCQCLSLIRADGNLDLSGPVTDFRTHRHYLQLRCLLLRVKIKQLLSL
jgi:hypothetical protein